MALSDFGEPVGGLGLSSQTVGPPQAIQPGFPELPENQAGSFIFQQLQEGKTPQELAAQFNMPLELILEIQQAGTAGSFEPAPAPPAAQQDFTSSRFFTGTSTSAADRIGLTADMTPQQRAQAILDFTAANPGAQAGTQFSLSGGPGQLSSPELAAEVGRMVASGDFLGPRLPGTSGPQFTPGTAPTGSPLRPAHFGSTELTDQDRILLGLDVVSNPSEFPQFANFLNFPPPSPGNPNVLTDPGSGLGFGGTGGAGGLPPGVAGGAGIGGGGGRRSSGRGGAGGIGLGRVPADILPLLIERIQAGGVATPEDVRLIGLAAQSALDIGRSDIFRVAQQALTQLREELAPSLGLRPGDSPILDRGALVAEEATRQLGQLARSVAGQAAQAQLSFPVERAGLLSAQALPLLGLSENQRQFGQELGQRQSEFGQTFGLAEAATRTGLNLEQQRLLEASRQFGLNFGATNLQSGLNLQSAFGNLLAGASGQGGPDLLNIGGLLGDRGSTTTQTNSLGLTDILGGVGGLLTGIGNL